LKSNSFLFQTYELTCAQWDIKYLRPPKRDKYQA